MLLQLLKQQELCKAAAGTERQQQADELLKDYRVVDVQVDQVSSKLTISASNWSANKVSHILPTDDEHASDTMSVRQRATQLALTGEEVPLHGN